MRFQLLLAAALVVAAADARGSGVLVPADRAVGPLAMVKHSVHARVEEQVAVTTVEQVFRNHTARPLEATYVFPVPRGASVNKFTMWVDGKETSGELLDAKQAAAVYTDIVRRTQDPGLLEYLGNDLMRMRVFPVPARGDQRVKVQFVSVCPKEGGVVEYLYPAKTDGKATRTLEEFSAKVTIVSRDPLRTVYSPTHAITVRRTGETETTAEFEKNQTLLDKDFQLFFASSRADIGVTALPYRPVSADDGYVMLFVNPQADAAKAMRVPRDLVLVLDKSGSMSDQKMAQARKALKHCLTNLKDGDRFALVAFSTAVDTFKDALADAGTDNLERAGKWVDDLRQSGGTAILPALNRALDYRGADAGRAFTVVFFTDGMPTVDETDPDKIVKAIDRRNSANTRIFTFGVGDDVNAAMLDKLADTTRGAATYVRPTEDIESKASALHEKISHPVMTDVRLTCDGGRLYEVYPPKLPDLFHGSQLVVIGKFAGQGPVTFRLTGKVGGATKEVVEEAFLPTRTAGDGKEFVEHLWARRKVGYLLDQIRSNGEQRELVDEVTKLAKRYGIATPYTSYLVVPDGPMPVAAPGRAAMLPPGGPGNFGGGFGGGGIGGGGFGGGVGGPPQGGGLGGRPGSGGPGSAPPGMAAAPPPPTTSEVARKAAADGKGDVAAGRGGVQDRNIDEALKKLPADKRNDVYADALTRAKGQTGTLKEAEKNIKDGNLRGNQVGKQGVDWALENGGLRSQSRLSQTANRAANGRNVVEVDGVWIDDKFDAKMAVTAVKAQSEAYFRILEKQPQMKDVYRLGNHVLWVAPNGSALIIDPGEGKAKLTDAEIDALFAAKK